MISTFLFDLDGTLYDRDALIRELATAQYATFRTELERVGAQRFSERLVELDDHGYAPKDRVYRQLGEEWGLSADVQRRLIAHFWSSYDGLCRLADDTRRTLETLKQRGKTLGLITNGGTERQNRKIDALGIRPLLDAVLISETEGVRKPDSAIFERALARCSAAAGETIYVGDHPQIDIEGARAAGLVPVWKTVPYWTLTVPSVRRIERLSELLDLPV
jgi:putative hydrolase of the HAD superfamily